MKIFLFLILLCLPQFSLAESTTVYPFTLEFFGPLDRYQVESKLTLSCRYEKFVISDSAQYIVKSENHFLPVHTEVSGGKRRFVTFLKDTLSMELNGSFKPTKQCMSRLQITFKDKYYAMGWGGSRRMPISFSKSTNQFYRSGDTELSILELENLLAQKFIDFSFHPVPNLQVNVWLTVDGKREYPPTSSAIDPLTNRPYPLR